VKESVLASKSKPPSSEPPLKNNKPAITREKKLKKKNKLK